MWRGLLFSVALHGLLGLVLVTGLPGLFADTVEQTDTPVVLDMVEVAEETNAPRAMPTPKPEKKKPEKPQKPDKKDKKEEKPDKKEKKEPAPEDRPDKKPEKPDKPAPEPAPKLMDKPEPAPQPKPTPAPEKAPEPKPEKAPEPTPKPEPAPEEDTPPEPPESPAPPETEGKMADVRPRAKPEPPDAFTQIEEVVGDLARQADEKAEEEKDAGGGKTGEDQSLSEMLGGIGGSETPHKATQKLTISEIDAIRHKVQKNWNLPAGAKNAREMVVRIRLRVAPDGRVLEATIVDRGRMRDNPFFRSMAESARRAVFAASPLPIPEDKYGLFEQGVVFKFSPEDMF